MSSEIDQRIYEELVKIRILLERLARNELRKDLESIATTRERKMIWALCNGANTTSDIASRIGISQRAVQIFINELRSKDLINVKRRGYPKRKFDYIPSSWGIEME